MSERQQAEAALRQKAEAIAREKAGQSPEQLEALLPEETRQTLHELRVHQIELEMQNEELRRAQVELDAARARYYDLYDLAVVGHCTLSEQGAHSGSQPHRRQLAGCVKKRSGQATADNLCPPRGPGHLLPVSQTTV
jgi:hypothetical protein